MKVILLNDVKGSGKKGDIVNVSDGFARNFLLPKNLAKIADESAIKDLNTSKAAQAYKLQVQKEDAQKIADTINDKTVKIFAKPGKDGKIFGSVTSKEVAAMIEKNFGVKVDKHKLKLSNEIKAFGTYTCELKLFTGVLAKVNVMVCENE